MKKYTMFSILVLLSVWAVLTVSSRLSNDVAYDMDAENSNSMNVYPDFGSMTHEEIQEWIEREQVQVVYPDFGSMTQEERREWETIIQEAKKKTDEWYAKQNIGIQQTKRREYLSKQYWESRKEWIDNFPYKPTYNPYVVYSSNLVGEIQIEEQEADVDAIMLGPGSIEDKLQEIDDQERKWIEAYNKEIGKRRCLFVHGLLKGFYSNDLRFTKEFEMTHDIFNEYGYGDNTAMNAYVFTALLDYNKSVLEDPDEMSHYNETWGESANASYDVIAGHMLIEEMYVDGKPMPSRELAEEIRERLINEIPSEGFVDENNMGMNEYGFAIPAGYRDELKEGDPLLYR